MEHTELATGGDAIFYGTMDGWFKAIDAKTCAELWKFKTGSGIVGNPIAYRAPDRKEYIAVYSGIGGWMGAVAFPPVSTDDPIPRWAWRGPSLTSNRRPPWAACYYVFSL